MEIETAKQFWVEFNKRLGEIKEELVGIQANAETDAATNTNIPKAFALIKQTLVTLQVFATESTQLLPSYDIRRTQEEIELAGKDIRQKEEIMLPRKKFRFSRNRITAKHTDAAAKSANNAAELAATQGAVVSAEEKIKNNLLEGSVLVIDQENTTVDISDRDFAREDCNGQLLVQRCKGCTVRVSGIAGSIRLEGLVDCTIFLGPCRTSVYIADCSNSVFQVACHQLRIHKTHASKIYARCRTHPIVEDCSTLGFGPYAVSYANIDTHFQQANLADASSWDNVVDFRWHRTTQSPNWYVIPEAQRETVFLGGGSQVNSSLTAGTVSMPADRATIPIVDSPSTPQDVGDGDDDEDEL
jgi:hypothetical protein